MKKRCGYISVYILIIMFILMIMIYSLIHITDMGNHISLNTINNTQSFYIAEGKIFMVLYDKYFDKEFYPFVADVLRGSKVNSKEILLDNVDLDKHETPTKLKLSLVREKGRMKFELKSEANYKGIKTSLISIGNLINDYFELGIPILSPSKARDSLDTYYKLLDTIFNEKDKYMDNIHENIYIGQFSSFDRYYLDKNKHNSYLFAFRENMSEPYVEYIDKDNMILFLSKSGNNTTELIIGNEEDLNKIIELNGLLIVEGNIVVFNKLNFNGILILKDGDIIVMSEEKPSINGLVISNNDLSEENINAIYNIDNIYKFGVYLPGFIEPKILLIKSN